MWGRMMAAEPTPEQKVARLFERLGGAAGPDDVRKALGDLGELASEQAMRVSSAEDVTLLLRVLAETEEVEVKRDVLDVLVNLLDAKTPSSAPDAARAKAAFNLDAFLEDPAAVSAVLSCLEPEDMYVRYNAIQLMLIVLGAERGRVQNFVLTNPMGAAAATELLGDRREVVRNDALLLLAELSKDSGEISRLIAFQGAFDRLLEIIGDEAEEGGSVIIDDCLVLIATLLRQNPAAQRLFVETGTLERLAPYLSYDPTDPFTARFAPKQLTASQVRICAIVTTIAGDQVGSGTDEQTLRACRDRLGVSGLVKRLVGLTTSSSTATEPSLRQAAMHSLACAVRAHEPNQRILIEQRVPVPPARTEPAPLRMLALALRGATRASAEPPLRVLLALLDGSSFAQLHLAATLAPIPTGLSLSAAAGSTGAEGGLEPSFCRSLALVLVGKTAPSPSQALLAAAVLSALVRGNSDSKQLLMRMAVEPSLDDSASDKGTDEIANSADSGTGGVSRSVGSAAAASVLGRACRRLPGVARPSAETVDDADADAPRAALTLALLRTLAAFADDGCLPAVKLILDWPGLLPSLVDVAKGGALPEGGQAGARPLPLAADFEAVMHIRGQASLVLARCLLSAEHAGTGLTAPALFDLLQQHLGLDTLLENLESVRSSPPNLKALSGSSFKSHTPSVGDKGAQPDPAALAGLSPLAAYAQADARALGKTTDSLQAVILRLYTAASAPPAPPHVALPIPATTLKPVEQPPPSPSFETAAQHAHISEPPPAPTLLKGEDVQAFKQQQPLFQSTQPAEANGLPSGAPGLLFPGLVPGPAQQAESGMESGSPMSERGTGVRDGAWDGDREGVREVDEEATREEHASDQQLIREQDSQLQSALHAANSSKSAADEALTSTAHHFADKRRASAAAVALAASLADADEELHVAIAAAAAAAAAATAAEASEMACAALSPAQVDSTDASTGAGGAGGDFEAAQAQAAQMREKVEALEFEMGAKAEAGELLFKKGEAELLAERARVQVLSTHLAEAQAAIATHAESAASNSAGVVVVEELEASLSSERASVLHLGSALKQSSADAKDSAEACARAEGRAEDLEALLGEGLAKAERLEGELRHAAAAAAAAAVVEDEGSARSSNLEAALQEARAGRAAAERELAGKTEALEALSAEHEECLCCLAEQDMQCTALQEQLAMHGVAFPATPGETPTMGRSAPQLLAAHD